MTEEERREAMQLRIQRGGSWRRPPVWHGGINQRFLFTAACFEHAPHIGFSPARMNAFEQELLSTLRTHCTKIYAHVVLPNHYHALIQCSDIPALRKGVGQLHGRTALAWNREEHSPGRKVFHGSAETRMKSERHFYVSMNYVHHNAVRHGYAQRWQEWPWSSANAFLEEVGYEEAKQLWNAYPIKQYGKDWD